MPSEQPKINAVLSLNAQADKYHWQWCTPECQSVVCGYIAREAGRVSRRNGKGWLSDGPFNQSHFFVVVPPKNLLRLIRAVELLFCHVAEKLNVLKIKEISGIPHRYGEVKP